MLGKQIGDVIKVIAPAGEDQYEIIEVQYQAPDAPTKQAK